MDGFLDAWMPGWTDLGPAGGGSNGLGVAHEAARHSTNDRSLGICYQPLPGTEWVLVQASKQGRLGRKGYFRFDTA